MSTRTGARAVAWAALTLVGAALFFVAPAVAIVILAGVRWNLLDAPVWVGVLQISEVLADAATARAIGVTVTIGTIGLALELAGGLLLGRALARSRGPRILQAVILLPWIIAPLAVGAIARWVLAPSDGMLALALGHRIDLLSDPVGAPLAVAAVVAWQATGLAALLYASALRAIPSDVRAAAALDGAGGWRMLRSIEWPLVAPVTFFLMVTATIRAFALYDLVVPLTGGGPNGATLTISALIVQQAWESFDIGRAAALACVIVVLECAVIGAQLLSYRRSMR